MAFWIERVAAVAALSCLSGQAALAGDAGAGKAVFTSSCSICHSVQPGQNKIGPTLFAGQSGGKPDMGRADTGQIPGIAAGDGSGDENDLCRGQGCDQAGRPDRLSGDREIGGGGGNYVS